jgi:NAD(P)-dependent dehydrogenase (short-subunit alcohol dehydrogenase family)
MREARRSTLREPFCMTSILVTGANRGIGYEFVRQYASEGARIFACCRTTGKAVALEKLAAESDGRVTIHALEVTSGPSIVSLTRELHDQPLDILINNAGIKGDLHSFSPASNDMWEEVFRVNTIAPFRMAQALRPNLDLGQRKLVISISSGRGSHLRHRGDGIAYCSAKSALNSAMFGLSVQWKNDGYTIVMIAPGPVQTDMNPDARLTPEFSIGSMRKVIAGLTTKDNGRYLDYENKDVLW